MSQSLVVTPRRSRSHSMFIFEAPPLPGSRLPKVHQYKRRLLHYLQHLSRGV